MEPLEGNATSMSNPDIYQLKIGVFLRSEIEAVQSGFMRCIYQSAEETTQTVTILCEKAAGCCSTGCCSKDIHWMFHSGMHDATICLAIVVLFIGLIACFVCGFIHTTRRPVVLQKSPFYADPYPLVYQLPRY